MKETGHSFLVPRAVLFLLLLVAAVTTRAQVESMISCRRYTTQDGLPQMQAERIWQDSRGYIYIGTLSGFVRYDGHEFTPFLKGKRYSVVSFAEVEGEVWALSFRQRWTVGYDDVFMHPLSDDGKWLLNNFNSPDLPAGMVVMEDEQESHRWIGRLTAKGISRVATPQLADVMTPDRKLYVDSQAVYMPTAQGLYRSSLADTTSRRLSTNTEVYSLCRNGRTLYALAQDGIYTVDGDSLRLHTAYTEWQADYGLIVRAGGKQLLIADAHSIYSFDGESLRRLFTGINLIKDMTVDSWGRLWVATYQGVYCFFNRRFVDYRLTDDNDIARAVGIGAGGQTVIGTLNGKVIVDGRVVYDQPDNFFIPSTASVGGRVYLAGRDDVACVNDSALTWLRLPFERYQFLAEAGGRVIIGTRQLIASYDPQTSAVDTITTEVAHPWCAAADADGRLYIGSTFGLFRLDKGAKNVAKMEYDSQKLIVTTMEADMRGAVFFASGDSLFVIRGGEVSELSSQLPGLSGHEVRSLFVTRRGHLVVAAIDGLFVARITPDYHIADACFFNHLNGFTMLEPLKCRMAETADGTVFLCGIEEMASFRPEELIADSKSDTYIRPPLKWWQHWWVGLVMVALLITAVWLLTRWYEKRRSRRKMLKLQREKQEKEQLISAIREEAIRSEATALAQDIVKMTEKSETQRLSLRTVNGMLVVNAADIVYLKADGNYTQLVTFSSSDLVLTGIGALSKKLDATVFIRADRSTVVNLKHISRLNAAQRRCTFKSADGVELETTLMAPAFKRIEKDMES